MDKEVKVKRIGTITFGVILIILGILLAIQTFVNVNIFRYVLYLWPTVFILLGVEIIYYSFKKTITIKYDILGFIFTLVIIGFGCIIGFIHFGVNNLMNNNHYITNKNNQKIY